MKLHFNITELAGLENLSLAARRACRGKSRRPDVEEFHLREETHLLTLRRELLAGSWRPAGYRTFEIHEPKRRLISAAPYRDRVVHHALCHLLNPLLVKRFIARSFSCQDGKGTGMARACCRRLVNRHPYVLKCDIRKFFDSLNHAVLREKLHRLVRCPGVRLLMDRLIFSHAAGPGCGVPIGNLTSQWWGNYYLDDLDHWITEAQGYGAYVRYTDDFLIFGDDKTRLWELRAGIVEKLKAVRLELAEPKSRLLACREGVPFCGFRFLPGLAPRILGATKRRFERRRTKLAEAGDFRRLSISTFAWYQFSREGNSQGLREAWSKQGQPRETPDYL